MGRSNNPILGPYYSSGAGPVGEEETRRYDRNDGYSDLDPFPRGLGLPRKKTG